MANMQCTSLVKWLSIFAIAKLCYGEPVVTLKHGGQLRGQSTSFNNKPVDLFVGIRYAKAPVGNLRFKRPEPVEPWTGVVDALTSGSECVQRRLFETKIVGPTDGNEDCLFMDITVPGGVQPGSGKAVILFFHSGGFKETFGTGYIGGPMATTGDVIVISINFRLGIFGFLFDGPGTGNFGLWDQRAALVWIQENIEQFGGDPRRVTIFGKSSGAAGAGAFMVSPRSDGLFERAILSSGSLFMPWSWFLPREEQHEMVSTVRKNSNCPPSVTNIYDCLMDLSAAEVFMTYPNDVVLDSRWRPGPDEDFFPPGFEHNPNYELSKRFDLLAGVTGQEGSILVAHSIRAIPFETTEIKSAANGTNLQLTTDIVRFLCHLISPQAQNLCLYYVLDAYELDASTDDYERARRLTTFLSEWFFHVPTLDHLRQHNSGGKSTYAFYFDELYQGVKPMFTLPKYLKVSAAHLDDMPFLFGSAFMKDEQSPIWEKLMGGMTFTSDLLNQSLDASYQPLSTDMMTLWTNFAKTGNPNLPHKPTSFPEWPLFANCSELFMSIKCEHPTVVETRNANRLTQIKETLVQARNNYIHQAQSSCFT